MMYSFTCYDGFQCHVFLPSMALEQWVVKHLPEFFNELYLLGCERDFDFGDDYRPKASFAYTNSFLYKVLFCINKKYKKDCPFNIMPFTPDEGLSTWSSYILERYCPVNEKLFLKFKNEDRDVITYENYCLNVLKWLKKHGDILVLCKDGNSLSSKYRSIDDEVEFF